MRLPLRLAAALLPLAGLAAAWAMSARTYAQGTEWEVPVIGYDPRDLLRGHYVEFSYDWPNRADFETDGPKELCLDGAPPRIARVWMVEPAGIHARRPCAHRLRADPSSVYGWEALLRGRIYVGQARAAALQEQLRNRDQRGMVTIRQREDGSFAVIGIRFRPLTPAERAARDAADRGIAPSAPPIMEPRP